MKSIRRDLVIVMICAAAGGCASVSLAPGADQIRITRNSAEVSGCTLVGNVGASHTMMTDPDVEREMFNQTLAFGGNVLLVTSPLRRSGVAYRCGDHGPSSDQAVAPASSPAPTATIPGQTPIEVVQAQVDAFNRNDLQTFSIFYAEDVRILDYPDRVLIDGKDAVLDHYKSLFERSPQAQATIVRRMAFDRFVIDQQKISGGPDARPAEAVAIYEVKNGRIVRVTLLHP